MAPDKPKRIAHMSTDAYDDVLSRLRKLTADEQRLLADELKNLLQLNGKGRRSVLDLRGLGKDVWSGVDAQEYVRQERASWTG
jgi:hypothetical protein